jgi:hypothetical protein
VCDTWANNIDYITWTDCVGSASNESAEVMVSGTPIAPDAPTQSTVPTADSVGIQWEEPTDNGGSAITGYNLYYSTTNVVYTFIDSTSDV